LLKAEKYLWIKGSSVEIAAALYNLLNLRRSRIDKYTVLPELEFLNNVWGLGTE
jgi:hypothetical protein